MDNIVSFKGKTPKIDASAYIDYSAKIIGDVNIGKNASVWTNAEGQNGRPGQDFAFVLTTDYYSAGYYSTIKVVPPRDTEVSATVSPLTRSRTACAPGAEPMTLIRLSCSTAPREGK